MICPFCKEEIKDGALKCKHCGSMLDGSPSPNLKSGSNIPGGILTAGILMFLWAFIFGGLVLLYFVSISEININNVALIGWDLLITTVYIVFGIGVLKRQYWGYDWGLGSNVLNLFWGIYQIFQGKTIMAIFVPIEIAIIVLLLLNKKHFNKNSSIEPTSSNKIFAEQTLLSSKKTIEPVLINKDNLNRTENEINQAPSGRVIDSKQNVEKPEPYLSATTKNKNRYLLFIIPFLLLAAVAAIIWFQKTVNQKTVNDSDPFFSSSVLGHYHGQYGIQKLGFRGIYQQQPKNITPKQLEAMLVGIKGNDGTISKFIGWSKKNNEYILKTSAGPDGYCEYHFIHMLNDQDQGKVSIFESMNASDGVSFSGEEATALLLAILGEKLSILFIEENSIQNDKSQLDLNKAIELDPQNANAYYNRGTEYRTRNLFDQAIQDFAKAVELNPKYAEAYNGRGVCYFSKGLYDEALTDFNKAIELDPQNANAYYNRGSFYSDKSLYDQAVQEYTKAIEINPKFTEAYNGRGRNYLSSKSYDEALTDFNTAIGIDPQNANAYCNRGSVYLSKNIYDQAIQDYTKAIELNPKYANAYNLRGQTFLGKNLYDEALIDLNKAIELDPQNDNAYCNRGIIYSNKSLYDQAIQDYTKAIEINSKDFHAYTWRGRTYIEKGLYDQAIIDCSKAIELAPQYTLAYVFRGRSYYLKDLYDEALTDFNKAIELDPQYPGSYLSRGDVYFKKNLYDQAMRDLNKAIEIKPDYNDAYYLRAKVFFMQKDYDKAWADINKAEELKCKIEPEFIEKLKNESGRDQ